MIRASRSRTVMVATAVVCQLMLMVDGVIVLIALPDIRDSFGADASLLGWVVSAYALAFAALLLLSGRLSARLGARAALRIGVGMFVIASIAGGLAPSMAVLLLARVLQGAGAAIAAPSILVLIAFSTSEGPARLRAMVWYVAASSAGSAVGLVAGGLLTETSGWRSVMFVNVPIGVLILIGSLFSLETGRHGERLDIRGSVLAAVLMTAAVFGLARVGDSGGTDPLVYISLGVVLVTGFLLLRAERIATAPVLPPHLLRGARGLPYLGMALMPAALVGFNTFSVLVLQDVREQSPLQSGLSYLPWALSVVLAGQFLTRRLLARAGEPATVMLGTIAAVIGISAFALFGASAPLWAGVILPFAVTGLGPALFFTPLTDRIMTDAGPDLAGPAAALLQAMQQLGPAAGIALLTTVYSPLQHDGESRALTVTLFAAAGIALLLAIVLAAGSRTRQPFTSPAGIEE